MNEPYVAVFGASSMDIGAFPSKKPVPFDSNLGKVILSPGGVGFNIGTNLEKVGVPVALMTVFGSGIYGTILKQTALKTFHEVYDATAFGARTRTNLYVYMADEKGRMQIGVNDMESAELGNVKFLCGNEDAIKQAKLVVTDANMSPESLSLITNICPGEVIADAVSLAKAPRLFNCLPALRLIKPNLGELGLLAGIQIKDEETLRQACDKLLDLGLGALLISLGEKGAAYCQKDSFFFCEAPSPARIRSTNGGGDGLLAGFVWGLFQDKDPQECLKMGVSVSQIDVRSIHNVSPQLNAEKALELAKELKIERTIPGLF